MSGLLITNKTLEVQSLDAWQVYQVNNITKVGRYPYQKKSNIRASVFARWMLIGLCITWFADVAGQEVEGGAQDWMYILGFAGLSIIAGSLVVLAIAGIERIMNPKKYLFIIETGNSMAAILSSKSKADVDLLVDQVIQIMADPNKPVKYSQTIYENMVVGDQINQGDINGVGFIKN